MGELSSKLKTGAGDYYGKPFYFVHAAGGIGEHAETYIKGMETGPAKTETSIIRFGDNFKAEVRKYEDGTADYSETILSDSRAYSSKLKSYLESALGRSALIREMLRKHPHADWRVDSHQHTHMAGGGEQVTGSGYDEDHLEFSVTLDLKAKTIEAAIEELRKKPLDQLLAEAMRKRRLEEDNPEGHPFKFRTIFLVKVETLGVPSSLEEPVVREVRSLVETAQAEAFA